jgi:hypothetical protein
MDLKVMNIVRDKKNIKKLHLMSHRWKKLKMTTIMMMTIISIKCMMIKLKIILINIFSRE